MIIVAFTNKALNWLFIILSMNNNIVKSIVYDTMVGFHKAIKMGNYLKTSYRFQFTFEENAVRFVYETLLRC